MGGDGVREGYTHSVITRRPVGRTRGYVEKHLRRKTCGEVYPPENGVPFEST